MHRIVVDVQTGEVTQVEYTAEEQAAYDAAIAQQQRQEYLKGFAKDPHGKLKPGDKVAGPAGTSEFKGKGVAEGELDEAVGSNYLYHGTSAEKAKKILSSIRSSSPRTPRIPKN